MARVRDFLLAGSMLAMIAPIPAAIAHDAPIVVAQQPAPPPAAEGEKPAPGAQPKQPPAKGPPPGAKAPPGPPPAGPPPAANRPPPPGQPPAAPPPAATRPAPPPGPPPAAHVPAAPPPAAAPQRTQAPPPAEPVRPAVREELQRRERPATREDQAPPAGRPGQPPGQRPAQAPPPAPAPQPSAQQPPPAAPPAAQGQTAQPPATTAPTTPPPTAQDPRSRQRPSATGQPGRPGAPGTPGAPGQPPAAQGQQTPPAQGQPPAAQGQQPPPAGQPPAAQGQRVPPSPGQPPAAQGQQPPPAGQPPAGQPALAPSPQRPASVAPPTSPSAPPAAQAPTQPVVTQSGSIQSQPAGSQGQPLRRMEQMQGERRESREGDRLIIREPDRVIIQEGGRSIIRHNETNRFLMGGREVSADRRGTETTTIVERPDGTRIVTVTDDDGRLIRRVRRARDGREIIIIDNRDWQPGASYYVELPPPVIRIAPERYIVEAARTRPEIIYETLMAPPVERITRRYTLDEVRYSLPLRDRMPRVDLDTITFESGSWEIMPDQINRLAVVASGISRGVARNPSEVFLIEGHTDAVGADVDNLSLSDRRAESVALALTERFKIPPENLTTQGYGEQYLKVPTQEAERANRRVTVRRITPLLTGQAQSTGQAR